VVGGREKQETMGGDLQFHADDFHVAGCRARYSMCTTTSE
jgi:hypothetical protein